jgi:hypothetical protein
MRVEGEKDAETGMRMWTSGESWVCVVCRYVAKDSVESTTRHNHRDTQIQNTDRNWEIKYTYIQSIYRVYCTEYMEIKIYEK